MSEALNKPYHLYAGAVIIIIIIIIIIITFILYKEIGFSKPYLQY